MCIMGRERKLGWPGVTGPKTDTVGGLTEARGGSVFIAGRAHGPENHCPLGGDRGHVQNLGLSSPEVM